MVLNPNSFQNVILEQGDILYISEKTSIIMVHGEVAFPNGIEYSNGLNTKNYIEQIGDFSQKSNKSKVIVIQQNGKAELVSKTAKIQQGNEILVLPKAQTKGIELTHGITQVIYQIAVAVKVALDL
ncbi:hypothetical protein [Acinetobacter sp.]|uniref:hypothetical protein n=1 Tax=Acinetobacter sp. TaxID=472 RepID=UPI00388D0ADF